MSGRRVRYRVLGLVWLAAALALATPLVPWAWRPRPLLLGLPPGFVWVISWLAIVFAALVWVYRGEAPEPEGESGREARREH